MAATDSPGGANIAEPGEMPAESGPSFRFEARRARLDWRLLHSVDVDRLMRENDLDMLETTLVRARPKLPPEPVAPRARASARSLTFPFRVPFTSPDDDPSSRPSRSRKTGDRRVRRRHRRGQPQPHRQQQPQDPPPRAVPGGVPPSRAGDARGAQGAPAKVRRGGAARVHRRQVPSQARARPRQGAQTRAANRAEGPQDVRGFGADPIGQTVGGDPHRRHRLCGAGRRRVHRSGARAQRPHVHADHGRERLAHPRRAREQGGTFGRRRRRRQRRRRTAGFP